MGGGGGHATQRRRKPRWASASADGSGVAGERARETAELVADVLDADPVDLRQLRCLAAVRGLGTNALRARAWPLLLGASAGAGDGAALDALADAPHRDASVVECDVQRSLWAFTEGWPDDRRAVARASLRRMLNAAVAVSGGRVHYYQGLHDVASVLLLVCGDVGGFRLLRRLAGCQLRDCTRPTLDAALETLGLLMPILAQLDPELHAHIAASGVAPHFALPWTLTWFARSAGSLATAARLFDLFAASHPLMPLYVAAVAMQAERDMLLATEADPAEMHRALNNMPLLVRCAGAEGAAADGAAADGAARRAIALYRRAPPAALLRRNKGLQRWSTAPMARLAEAGHWEVDDEAPPPRGRVRRKQASGAQPSGRAVPPAARVAALAAASGLAALVAALVAARGSV